MKQGKMAGGGGYYGHQSGSGKIIAKLQYNENR